MPKVGSQVILCDLPVRFDTYKGCTHDCSYCFARKRQDIGLVALGETASDLRGFIAGRRGLDMGWIDWKIPIHWGGLSDPFQPAEKQQRASLQALVVFAETKYPVVISTKGRLCVAKEYLELFRQCDLAIQVSMLDSGYDAKEPGAPTFEERLSFRPVLAAHTRRVVVRLQPYYLGTWREVVRWFGHYADAGVHGVTVEGFKSQKALAGGVKVGGDYCYEVTRLRKELVEIRRAAHEHGLAFYSAENRLRDLGDDPCCCGVADLWEVNKANLNHMDADGVIPYRESMKRRGTGACFRGVSQSVDVSAAARMMTFEEGMEICRKTRGILEVMGRA